MPQDKRINLATRIRNSESAAYKRLRRDLSAHECLTLANDAERTSRAAASKLRRSGDDGSHANAAILEADGQHAAFWLRVIAGDIDGHNYHVPSADCPGCKADELARAAFA